MQVQSDKKNRIWVLVAKYYSKKWSKSSIPLDHAGLLLRRYTLFSIFNFIYTASISYAVIFADSHPIVARLPHIFSIPAIGILAFYQILATNQLAELAVLLVFLFVALVGRKSFIHILGFTIYFGANLLYILWLGYDIRAIAAKQFLDDYSALVVVIEDYIDNNGEPPVTLDDAIKASADLDLKHLDLQNVRYINPNEIPTGSNLGDVSSEHASASTTWVLSYTLNNSFDNEYLMYKSDGFHNDVGHLGLIQLEGNWGYVSGYSVAPKLSQ